MNTTFSPNIKYWSLLQTKSKRAITRSNYYNGKPYYYNPRHDLMKRLAGALDESTDEVYSGLMEIRKHWLESQGLA